MPCTISGAGDTTFRAIMELSRERLRAQGAGIRLPALAPRSLVVLLWASNFTIVKFRLFICDVKIAVPTS